MKQMQQEKSHLLWLIQPEDSSNWELVQTKHYSKNQNLKEISLSLTKSFICYALAIAVTVFLSGLH